MLADPEVKQKLLAQGLEDVSAPPPSSASSSTTRRKWGEVIRAAGLKGEEHLRPERIDRLRPLQAFAQMFNRRLQND